MGLANMAIGATAGAYLGYRDQGTMMGAMGGGLFGGVAGGVVPYAGGRVANWLGGGKGLAGMGQRALGGMRGWGRQGAAEAAMLKKYSSEGAETFSDLVKKFPNARAKLRLERLRRTGAMKNQGWRGKLGMASNRIGTMSDDVNKFGGYAMAVMGASSASQMGSSWFQSNNPF